MRRFEWFKNCQVTVGSSSDKRFVPVTFAITIHGQFLLMHLIFKGKTVQSPPRIKFLQGFCVSANEKYFLIDSSQCSSKYDQILLSARFDSKPRSETFF